MTEPAAPPAPPKPKSRNPNRPRIDYPRAAILISQGLTMPQVAPMVGAANGNTLKVGLARKGITARIARNGDVAVKRAETVATAVLERLSGESRHQLAGVVHRQSGALAKVPARASIDRIAKVGAACETLVRSADKLFGWSKEEEMGVINVALISNVVDTETQQVIDVQSEPTSHNERQPMLDAHNSSDSGTTDASPAAG